MQDVGTENVQTGTRAINAGLGANLVLALLKVGGGILGHSEALLADGINSTSDVAYYVVVKIFMLFARRPPDREHPFGHRQLESIAALAVGAFVITTAVAVRKARGYFAGLSSPSVTLRITARSCSPS